MKTISPRELKELCDANGETVSVLDVRTPMEFQEVHLQVAHNVPLDSLEPDSYLSSRNGQAEEPLYIICRSGSRGKQACQKFIDAGFKEVINIDGGTLACVESGLPVVRGKKVMSLERQVRIAAGSFVLLGAILAVTVNEAFIGLSAFIGAGLVFAGLTDTCGMGMIIAKMPWNKVSNDNASKENAASCGTKECAN